MRAVRTLRILVAGLLAAQGGVAHGFGAPEPGAGGATLAAAAVLAALGLGRSRAAQGTGRKS